MKSFTKKKDISIVDVLVPIGIGICVGAIIMGLIVSAIIQSSP